jgi:hypothetical protein
MASMVYGPAIRDAIKTGDSRTMKLLLRRAKTLHAKQGDLGKAIDNLERALRKLTRE